MVNITILAGGYTSFIASYVFNTDTETLTYLNQYQTGDNPSWIIGHPTNASILYAANEDTPGALQSFVVGDDGALTTVDTIYSGGNGPPYVGPLTTGQIAVADYGSGQASVIATQADGLHFVNGSNTITFPTKDSGPYAGVSEPHMALQVGEEVFVPDRSGDTIWRIGQDGDSAGQWSLHGQIQHPNGTGPRHIRVVDNMLYTVHEFASTLTMQAVPSYPNGTSDIIANVSIIPPNPPSGSSFAGGELLAPPPSTAFPKQYFYASNRNLGTQDPRGDSIAIFENDNNQQLTLVQQVYTGLDQIRGVMVGPSEDGADAYFVAAGVAGTAGVKVFKRTDGGANMTLVATDTTLPTRTSFVLIPQGK
ncbi:putative isomerase YbhE [Coniophora puteana RWD-64-598 SS2]|uniref:Putative isomerase YbhE n=1 Tax=Coniophora puteana (strain RWD-64-598) TaxID=741705 RepID=A0A5M3MAB8_CONPW|nr:putative isomerase YbhE [Coniophora puteana RWD-64-598 SS2]EIW75591.1 putative isomerase YbhE [Coniophora puteana RWD-64-598 SS2]